MGVLIRDRSELQAGILDRLREANLLTNLSAGRAAFILSQVHSDQLGELYEALEINTSQAYVASANGPFLDLIAELFGLFRLPQQAALSLADERNVRFFVTSGTLAALIPSKVIALGTTITSSDGSITYQVLENARFNDVATEVFVSVVSQDVGPTQNVGRGELLTHNLGIGALSVTNLAPIDTASDVETDDQLRSRISDANLTRATANEASIREAAHVVPGVSDIRVQPFRNGPGTVQLTIIPVSNTVNPRLLALVQNNIEQVRGAGTIIDLRGPRLVPVEITIVLRFREDAAEGDKPQIRILAKQAIIDYIASLKLGQTFITQEMIQRVLDVDELILEFETRCFLFRGRPQVFRNFQPDPDELLVPDPDLTEPIRVL
jgi:uncharacterized phage protein gp47/JayE